LTRLLRYAVLGEGSSDRALLPSVAWVIEQCAPAILRDPYFFTRSEIGGALSTRMIREARRRHDAQLLFVHADCDDLTLDERFQEVANFGSGLDFPVVPLVPRRTMESWLLSEEAAIRVAANNRNGAFPLDVPAIGAIEGLRDPKSTLFELLRTASGLPARRLRRFDVRLARVRVAEVMEDYATLRGLPAFRWFEEATRRALNSIAIS
jgi:hypothetical protein